MGAAFCTYLWRIPDLSHRSQRVPSLVTFVLIGTMARCATWPSCSFISSPRSPDSLDVAVLVPLSPSRFCSNISCRFLIGRGRERRIFGRPSHCGPLHRLDAPFPPAAFSHRAQACDDHGVPPRIGEAQVSTPVLSAAPWKAGTQRACPRADR